MTNLEAIFDKAGDLQRMHLHVVDFDGDSICSTLIFARKGGILDGAILAIGLGIKRGN